MRHKFTHNQQYRGKKQPIIIPANNEFYITYTKFQFLYILQNSLDKSPYSVDTNEIILFVYVFVNSKIKINSSK